MLIAAATSLLSFSKATLQELQGLKDEYEYWRFEDEIHLRLAAGDFGGADLCCHVDLRVSSIKKPRHSSHENY